MRDLLALPGGGRVFRYRKNGDLVALTASQLNGYVRDYLCPEFSAEDFRTWGALSAAVALAEYDQPRSEAEAKRVLAPPSHAASGNGSGTRRRWPVPRTSRPPSSTRTPAAARWPTSGPAPAGSYVHAASTSTRRRERCSRCFAPLGPASGRVTERSV